MAIEKDDHFRITYNFSFGGLRPDAEFRVLLDKKTLLATHPEASREQEWTRLAFHQCPICPLRLDTARNCPIAFNISGLVDEFSEMISFEMVETHVHVPERSYYKRDSIQQGLRSILGIYLAASGCPHMNVLKPMVRFHLPFASPGESLYRHVTSYLMQQYYEHVDGRQPDLDLKGLKRKHDAVDEVNRGMIARVGGSAAGDANCNALLVLNVLGIILKDGIDERLEAFKYLYRDEP